MITIRNIVENTYRQKVIKRKYYLDIHQNFEYIKVSLCPLNSITNKKKQPDD
jgi:hypothetical protein